MANVMFVGNKDKYNYVTDTIGYNKYYGWYVGKSEDFGPWLDDFHKTNPNVKLGISEYGAEGIIQYHNNDPKVKDYSEEYHALYHETVWKIFEKRPYLWSTYVWNMFDFGANIRNEGGVKGRNNKGLVTYDRKVRKDAFYMYKAHWSGEKFVHITSKRFVDRVEDKIKVKIYSNCKEVTLYVNGVETSTKVSDEKVFIFEDIALKDGINEIKAVAFNEGVKLEDIARFNKVNEPNMSYKAPEEEGGFVSNWFEMPDLGDIEVEEITITDDVYSTECSLGELLENKDTKAVIDKYLVGIEEHPMLEMAKGMPIDNLAEIAPEQFNEKMMYTLNRELTKIKRK